MVRLSDLPEAEARAHLERDCVPFDTEPFVSGPPVSERRVAIVTTAGLHRQSDRSFGIVDAGYRVIPGDETGRSLVMSHASANFDRTGFQQDVNVVFPIDRLRALAEAGEIGSVAGFHYALMGATWQPPEMERSCREIAGLLKEDRVNAALLVPV